MESMKKIKGIFKNKTALLLVGALILGFGGTVLYLSQTDKSKQEENKQEEKNNNENENNQTEKGEGLPAPETTTKTPPPVQENAPTGAASLSALKASVTAQKSVSDNSIAILFYLEGSGWFTAQEKSGSSWVTVKENQYYAGSGGFSAGSIPAGQASKTMRVLKIENGKYSAVTKEFTVNRAEVEAALGIKTYN